MLNLVKIDPPGSWCQNEAALDMIKTFNGKTFVEIGCGSGNLSLLLCKNSYTGTGIDFSSSAIKEAKENLKNCINKGQFSLTHDDFMKMENNNFSVDFAISMMVMEHINDDVSFVKKMTKLVKSNGHVVIAVPARKEKWSIEDETVGHLRRYDRKELENVLLRAELKDIKIWSVAVPTANFLFYASNFLIKNSDELKKVANSTHEQTKASGIREIPFKTVFPSFFRIILNRKTLSPLFIIQRLFYNSSLGLTLIGSGRVS